MRETSYPPGEPNGSGTSVSGEHPGVERWIAYHGAELPDHEMARLRGHLVRCRDCVSILLDLDEFVEPRAASQARLSEFEMAAAWRSMRAALPPPATEKAASAIGYRSWAERRVPVMRALAVSLMAGVVGLGFWVAEHRKVLELRASVESYSQPQTHLSIVDLMPDTATRSGESSPPPEVGRDGFVALIILPSQPFDTYRVEILDPEARAVWRQSGLRAHPEFGTLKLGLPPGYLKPGDYRIRLYGGDSKTALEDDYPIHVTP